MDTIQLSISAGNGPEECARAAALTLEVLTREAELTGGGLTIRIIETCSSRVKGNIRSALIAVKGNQAESFARSWTGVIKWVWKSAYRPNHKRKNWFVEIGQVSEPEPELPFSLSDVRFETARAGGPGGQYVNKTESAVRAVHVPSGKYAAARGERSQLMNKRLALVRLARLFERAEAVKEEQSRSDLRHSHWELERGNPIRVYDGETLELLSSLIALRPPRDNTSEREAVCRN